MTLRRIDAWAGCSLVLGLLSACGDDNADNDGTTGAGGSHSAGAASSGGSSGAPSSGGSSGAPQGGTGGIPQGQAGADGGASMSGGMDSGTGGSENSNPSWWRPHAGLTWQWQLSEPVSDPIDVDVYDIDWEVEASVVEDLHARGIKVICYVSVGSWEDFRPDADAFPESVIGNDYDGWPGERYVDIRSAALREVLEARFDVCREKGFDAIEPDNMDVFELGDESGFPLTQEDGVEFALWLAEQAHARGLGIGQKNAAGITAEIVDHYDWALTESCFSDGNWCGDVSAYEAADKPVFMCEYEESSFADACQAWAAQGYSPILKNLDLDAPITFCP
jgi:hypothetical protein